MMPYYSFPFEYGNWKSPDIQPIQQAPQLQPVPLPEPEPVLETELEPIMQPSPQPCPPCPPCPQPVQYVQPLMPLCPYQMAPGMIAPNMMAPNMMAPGIVSPGMMAPGKGGMADVGYMEDGGDVNFTPPFPEQGSRVPVLSNNPVVPSITLFKELTGYPNYGNPSGNADILYTGDRGAWTFDVPAPLFGTGNFRAQIVIRGVLDDHYNVPENRYTATITVNGRTVHTGRVPFVHGRPAGARFNNWRELTLNVPNLRRNNRVVIVNTSNAGTGDWIAFDWMELRLIPR